MAGDESMGQRASLPGVPRIWRSALKTVPASMMAVALGLGALLIQTPTHADGFNPMNMMNPGKWFGKGSDRYGPEDGPPVPPPGYGTPYGPPPLGPGFGGPPPGPGFGAPPPYVGGGAPMTSYPSPTAPTRSGYGVAPRSGYSVPRQVTGYAAPAPQPSSGGPSREEMARRIKELENRLEDMETKNRQSVPAPQPTTPPPATYQYYSGDQTPQASSQYPFRPMDLGR